MEVSRLRRRITSLASVTIVLGILVYQLLFGPQTVWQEMPARMIVPEQSNQLQNSTTLPEERKIAIQHPPASAPQYPYGGAFVHIGKTGGSTLSALLRNGCHSYMKHPCYNISQETAASLLIESYYHVPDLGSLQQSDHDFYLITARDPLDRTISAFVFEHLQNRDARNEQIDSRRRPKYEKAYRCFPTLEVFCDYLKGDSFDFSYPYHKGEVRPASCKDLARAALHGKVRLYNHFFFGFDRIRNFIPKVESKRLYIARQEELWSDWNEVNQLLEETFKLPSPSSRPSVVVEATKRNSTGQQMPVGKSLSAAGVEALCRALEREYRAFFWLLHKAENIQEQHFQLSLEKAKERCGHALNLNRIVRQVRVEP